MGPGIDGGLGWRFVMLYDFGFPGSLEYGIRLWISLFDFDCSLLAILLDHARYVIQDLSL